VSCSRTKALFRGCKAEHDPHDSERAMLIGRTFFFPGLIGFVVKLLVDIIYSSLDCPSLIVRTASTIKKDVPHCRLIQFIL